MDALGMPKPISGNFATVFRITGADGRNWGVKCFTHYVADQQIRYERISACIKGLSCSWNVPFDYISRGIRCMGTWYPVLRMEWIEASALIPYIEAHLRQPTALAKLAGEFAAIVRELGDRGIAHGDLQHGNLLVAADGGLKLIDYDGMYVPGLEQLGASELGHRNYQSPARSKSDWGPALDRFSAWVIYGSLVALAIEPSLWGSLHRDGDEALILTESDFREPSRSVALLSLASSPDPRLQALARLLEPLGAADPAAISPLDPDLIPAPAAKRTTVSGSPGDQRSAVGADASVSTAEWLASIDSQPMPLSGTASDPSWVLDHLPPVARVAFRSPSTIFVRSLFGAAIASIGLMVCLLALRILPLLDLGFGIPALVFLFVGLCWLSFQRNYENRDRHSLHTELRRLRKDDSHAREALTKAENYRAAVDRREREELQKYEKIAKKAVGEERSELKKIEARLSDSVRKIERNLASLSNSEARERDAALRRRQDAHVTEQMTRAKVSSANIPGFGPSLRAALQANGITSAADFTGISYVNSQAFIQLRSGRRVHPRGVGSVKAESLNAWRRSVETRARMTQPSALPSHEAQAIQIKYADQKRTLERSVGEAKAAGARELQQAQRKWADAHQSISVHTAGIRKTYAGYRADADVSVIGARRSLNSASWLYAAGRHRMAAYSGVTFARYIARGIRG
jgi:hypothetical protein